MNRCVVIANEQDKILLIKSKRYTTGRMEWEIPAGRIERGECAENAARRECLEETGCEITSLQYLCSQNPCNGITDILIHYYLAKVSAEEAFDENEILEKCWATKEEAACLLQANESRCGVSCLDCFMCCSLGDEKQMKEEKLTVSTTKSVGR